MPMTHECAIIVASGEVLGVLHPQCWSVVSELRAQFPAGLSMVTLRSGR